MKSLNEIQYSIGAKPNVIDLFIGARLRLRRIALGMSVEELARAAGLTSDALCELEAGSECLGAARLHQFGSLLSVPVSWFFAGLGHDGEVHYGGRLAAANDAAEAHERAAQLEELRHCFETLKSKEFRNLVLQIAQALSDREARQDVDNSARN